MAPKKDGIWKGLRPLPNLPSEGIVGPVFSKVINKIIINYKFPISRRDDMQDWLARAKGPLQDRLEKWLSQNKD